MSRLMSGAEGMVREDYKLSAWDKDKQAEALFYWKTQYRLPPVKKEAAFKEENAEEILRQMVEEKDESSVNVVFLLAVMLERKRILIERGVQRDAEGRQIRIYEHKESGETFLIPDPELSLDQIEEVQQEIALKLGWIKAEVVPVNILFLCTGNSCRSQMAEGWAKHLKAESLQAFSAGIEKHGLNPNAVKVMAEAGVDITAQSSQHIDEFKEVPLDVVVTVCDRAHESCPVFPEDCKVVHVSFDDPPTLAKALAESGGDEEAQLAIYRRVRDEIREFVEGLPGSLEA